MTEYTVLDTTIHEPPMMADEVDMLLFAVDRSRAQFAWKCGGLDAAGLRKPHPPFDADPDWEWRTAAGNSPEELYRLWRGAVERSRAAMAGVLAGGGPGQASKFTTRSGRSPALRRVLVDLHDEYARHVGHADLMREAVDGLVGEDPPQP